MEFPFTPRRVVYANMVPENLGDTRDMLGKGGDKNRKLSKNRSCDVERIRLLIKTG